jgi:signal peptidase I
MSKSLDTVKTESELPPPTETKEKGFSFWGFLFRFLWILVFVVVISISGQIIYDYTRYDNFWVSGDSMYPTLNKDATCSIYPGQTNKGTWGNFAGRAGTDVTYVCDYGLSDSSANFVSKLKRFDIVVAHYDNTFNPSWNGDESKKWSEDAVIKRLIGLPGEELYFETNGNLFVKTVGASDFVLVEQPKAIVEDTDTSGNCVISRTASAEAISLIAKSSGAFYGSSTNHAVLQDDEYFVVGDNRRIGASDDSRKYGPLGIKHRTNAAYPLGKDLLGGRAVAVTAKRKVVVASNGNISNHWLFGSTLMPWAIKYLGPDGEGGDTASIVASSLSAGALSQLYYSWRRGWHN